MIDEDRTLQLFGYTSDMLSYGSNHKIIRICDKCGKCDEIFFNTIHKAKYPNLCQSCGIKDKNNPNYRQGLITIKCSYCGKLKQVKPTHKREHNFCNHKCMSKWQSENLKGNKSHSWEGGISYGKYCSLFNKSFKQLIRNRFHNKCYLCNETQDRNLSVHHVNYNKNCLCQKTCEFVPLCGSCHSKTNKNRQYWEDLIMCYLYPNRYFMVEF